MKELITCKQAIDYISKKEEGKLSPWKRIRLWQHLAVCDLCSRFLAQNKLLAKYFSDQHQKQLHQLPEIKKQEIIKRILDNEGKQNH
jgi:hypothetical protein